jgi:hypothetical protein
VTRLRYQATGRRKRHVVWLDGHRQGVMATVGQSCTICELAIKVGVPVGRQSIPRSVAHWHCLEQRRQDDRTTPATCFVCGRPATAKTKIRGRWRPTCGQHDP